MVPGHRFIEASNVLTIRIRLLGSLWDTILTQCGPAHNDAHHYNKYKEQLKIALVSTRDGSAKTTQPRENNRQGASLHTKIFVETLLLKNKV